jgi:hypothetical protein
MKLFERKPRRIIVTFDAAGIITDIIQGTLNVIASMALRKASAPVAVLKNQVDESKEAKEDELSKAQNDVSRDRTEETVESAE